MLVRRKLYLLTAGRETETQTELMETLSAIKDEVNKQESCPATIRVLVKYAKKVLSGVVLSVNALEAFEQLWSLLQRAGVL